MNQPTAQPTARDIAHAKVRTAEILRELSESRPVLDRLESDRHDDIAYRATVSPRSALYRHLTANINDASERIDELRARRLALYVEMQSLRTLASLAA